MVLRLRALLESCAGAPSHVLAAAWRCAASSCRVVRVWGGRECRGLCWRLRLTYCIPSPRSPWDGPRGARGAPSCGALAAICVLVLMLVVMRGLLIDEMRPDVRQSLMGALEANLTFIRIMPGESERGRYFDFDTNRFPGSNNYRRFLSNISFNSTNKFSVANATKVLGRAADARSSPTGVFIVIGDVASSHYAAMPSHARDVTATNVDDVMKKKSAVSRFLPGLLACETDGVGYHVYLLVRGSAAHQPLVSALRRELARCEGLGVGAVTGWLVQIAPSCSMVAALNVVAVGAYVEGIQSFDIVLSGGGSVVLDDVHYWAPRDEPGNTTLSAEREQSVGNSRRPRGAQSGWNEGTRRGGLERGVASGSLVYQVDASLENGRLLVPGRHMEVFGQLLPEGVRTTQEALMYMVGVYAPDALPLGVGGARSLITMRAKTMHGKEQGVGRDIEKNMEEDRERDKRKGVEQGMGQSGRQDVERLVQQDRAAVARYTLLDILYCGVSEVLISKRRDGGYM